MNDGGVVFGDGIEADRARASTGASASTIGADERRLRLVA